MRFAVSVVTVAYATFTTTSASIVGRQSSLPSCAVSCVTSAASATSCAVTDSACLCNSQTYISSTITCLEAACSASGFLTAEEFLQATCNSVGITISIPTSSSTSSSSTSSPTSQTSASQTSTSTEASTSSASAVAPAKAGSGSSGTTSHARTSVIGPVVGGVIGGLALIIGAIIAFVIYRKRHRHTPSTDGDNEHKFNDHGEVNDPRHSQSRNNLRHGDNNPVDHPYSDSFSPASLAHFSPTPFNYEKPMPPPPVNAAQLSDSSASASLPAAHFDNALNRYPSASMSNAQSLATSTRPPQSVKDLEAQQLALARSAQSVGAPSSNSGLTSEQLITIQTLYKMNVPASEISALMERMRSETLAAGVASGSQGNDGNLTELAAPPRYDFKDT